MRRGGFQKKFMGGNILGCKFMVGFVLDREINDQIIQSGGGVSQNSFSNNLKI